MQRLWRSARPAAFCLFASYCAVPASPATAQQPPLEPARLEEPISPVPKPVIEDPLKVALGELLFEDPRLSRGGDRSCSSCHDLAGNGASPNRRDSGLDGGALDFNTLTVFNAALSFRLNWEGGFRTLESQAAAILENPRIMGGSLAEAVARLRADPTAVGRFEAVYGHGPDAAALVDALAAFQRSLLTPGGRFDRWLLGESGVLSEQEQEGYALFKSVGCVSCHQGVNVGGNLFQRHGIFHPLAAPDPEILRVPSLRNVAATPPYFHDGSAATLAEAVRMMGLAQLDAALTAEQIESIAAFLRTLGGSYRGRPVEEAP